MSNKIVLVTGGTGLIGSELIPLLMTSGYTIRILTRNPSGPYQYYWDPLKGEIDEAALKDLNYIIHLAGAGIADKRWTESRKKLIVESRVKGPELLLTKIDLYKDTLKAFISSSGINYYGVEKHERIHVESDPPGEGFVPHCVTLWEASIDQFLPYTRVVKLRTSLVLSRKSGALPRIEKPIRYGLGAKLGNGKQWVPWIHIKDAAGAFLFAIESNTTGVYNLVAGEHITNETLTRQIAKKLGKPLWLPPVPGFLLYLAFGKLASLVLKGSRASDQKLREAGYKFKFPTIQSALDNLYP